MGILKASAVGLTRRHHEQTDRHTDSSESITLQTMRAVISNRMKLERHKSTINLVKKRVICVIDGNMKAGVL